MDPRTERLLGRRTFLIGSTAAVVATACGSGGDSSAPAETATPITLGPDGPPIADPGQNYLGARFPDGFRAPSAFEAGAEVRAPFVAIDDTGVPVTTDAPDSITMTVHFENSIVLETDVAAQAKGEFTPYYPLEFTPSAAGNYGVTSSYGDIASWFQVGAAGSTPHPQVGQPMPQVITPTTADAAGVDPICTRQPEPCPFHETSLFDASASGPVALLVATPAFCQTDVCGPSVDFLIELADDYPDMTFVHAEVFAQSPNETPQPVIAPIIGALGIAWEPTLYVANAAGEIVSARHWAMSRADIKSALDAA